VRASEDSEDGELTGETVVASSGGIDAAGEGERAGRQGRGKIKSNRFVQLGGGSFM
jgi:hypothetical protein